jgi:hypothetical protein
LISKYAEVTWNRNNKKYYINKGYTFTNMRDRFMVKIEDISTGVSTKVEVRCDNKDCDKPDSYFVDIMNYRKYVKEDGKYYCRKCAMKLYGVENARKTSLKNSISFAQWGIDNICSDFLEKYWDYKKNIIKPSEISFSSANKIWIKCQEKDYHESYEITPYNFIKEKRCPHCNKNSGKVHILDSLGNMCSVINELWSDKNKKSPYDCAAQSNQKVWWKCPCEKHNDYLRSISSSYNHDFRCPECNFSKGEQVVSNILKNKNIYYTYQKNFSDLIGLGGGLLSYDFYLPDYNLLIEYQGEFHDNDGGNGNYYMKQNLKKQQEHDRRKKEYAILNNIKLLEIWYWDFDNIESILNEYLSNLKEVS